MSAVESSRSGPAAAARRLLTTIGAAEKGLSFVAFLVLIAVVFADVLSRELTGTGLHWAMQIGVYANYFVVMLGFGLASASGSHLRPRFADRWLPRAWEPLLERLQEALMALVCLAFAVLAGMIVGETRMLGDRSPVLGNLVWPLQILMPLVFTLAGIRHGLYACFPGLRPAQEPAAGPGEGGDGPA